MHFRKLFAILFTCLFCWLCTWLSINILNNYAFGLFIWLPFILGTTATVLYGYKMEVSKKAFIQNAFLTLGIYCTGLIVFAIEGIICIALAAPIGILFTWIGCLSGYHIVKNKAIVNTRITSVFLLLSAPAVLGFETLTKGVTPLHSVTTAVIINAAPQTIWNNVIAFPKIDNPKEWLFKTGIAYPITAEIDGAGVGAIRYSNFSTGTFTEQITVWNEPRLLKFDVNEQPESMKEVSLYEIHPKHLQGFFVSRQGQFKIIPLADGQCLLEGTTWYMNKIKPGSYWMIWSDYFIHQIHQRELNHIKKLSEKAS